MLKLNKASEKQFSGKFIDLTPKQRTGLFIILDKEQNDYTIQQYKNMEADIVLHKSKPEYAPPEITIHYFRMMKEVTLLGYFTSEIGATKALRYIETPGRYDGSMLYKIGTTSGQ